MRVHTNAALLRRRSRTSGAFLLAATVCLLGGFFLSLFQQDLAVQYGLSIASLVVGLFLWSRNLSYLQRWGPRWRQDAKLERALRGLDDRYHLLVAPGPALPDYLLVGPMGVFVVLPSAVGGIVRVRKDDWTHAGGRSLALRWLFWFSPDPSFGDPPAELKRAIQRTRFFLGERLPTEVQAQLKIEGLAVFTDPAISLAVQDPNEPATSLRSLRNRVQRLPKSLPNNAIPQVVRALIG